nr:aminoacetone oxidase family FAD-binding enzyme [uncultured Catonella sp.]
MANDIRDLIVIGGGASGMLTGILAARKGFSVSILEHVKSLGKKLSITGNGKCNFTNLYQEKSCYNSGDIEKAYNIINKLGGKGLIDLFSSFGIDSIVKKGRNFDRIEAGYVYPAGESAKEFVNILNDELIRLKVKLKTNINILDIKKNGEFFEIVTGTYGNLYSYFTKKLVIACGGMAGASTGSDGSLFCIIKRLGHSIIKPLPALTSVKTCKHEFAGLRCVAEIKAYVNKDDEQILLGNEVGELQFTEKGISGIPVMQLSGRIAKEIDKGSKLYFTIDFCYDKSSEELEDILKKRRKLLAERISDKFLTGFTYEKISKYIADNFLDNKNSVGNITDNKINMILKWLKEAKFDIITVSGFEAAQTTSGGVSMDEVTNNLESKFVSGLFFVGEVLDVDGLCGGYNLTWAFSSAYEVGNGG